MRSGRQLAIVIFLAWLGYGEARVHQSQQVFLQSDRLSSNSAHLLGMPLHIQSQEVASLPTTGAKRKIGATAFLALVSSPNASSNDIGAKSNVGSAVPAPAPEHEPNYMVAKGLPDDIRDKDFGWQRISVNTTVNMTMNTTYTTNSSQSRLHLPPSTLSPVLPNLPPRTGPAVIILEPPPDHKTPAEKFDLSDADLQSLAARIRSKGAPLCRSYPLSSCNASTAPVAPSCSPTMYALARSTPVANWFYIAYDSTTEPAPSFALDLTVSCQGFQNLLPPRTQYLSSGCNYNDGLIPKLPANTSKDMMGVVVAMGVLEQVCDVASFVQALKSYYLPIVISYAPVDVRNTDVSNRASSLTTPQWRQLLLNLNLTSPRWHATVEVDGKWNLLYWFEPDNWVVYAS